jgi:hypothetical protein
MPRNNLTDKDKLFVRENAALGGNALSQLLNVNRAGIYQFATDEGFSVKKGGKHDPAEKAIRKLKRGHSMWPKQYRRYKKMLVERDGLRCHYCDYLMTYQEAQVDHILAKARGGSDAPINLVLACSRCNNIKSTLCYECPEFRNAIGK